MHCTVEMFIKATDIQRWLCCTFNQNVRQGTSDSIVQQLVLILNTEKNAKWRLSIIIFFVNAMLVLNMFHWPLTPYNCLFIKSNLFAW